MTKEQVVEFLSDPKVITELKKLKSEDEVVSYLKENGIDITLEKAKTIQKALTTIDSYSGKLTDEQLDEIVGGGTVGRIMAGIVLGATAVAVIGGGGKLLYDASNEHRQRGTVAGKAKGFVQGIMEEAGVSEKTTYQQLVSDVADLF